jgi:hypothetical protein
MHLGIDAKQLIILWIESNQQNIIAPERSLELMPAASHVDVKTTSRIVHGVIQGRFPSGFFARRSNCIMNTKFSYLYRDACNYKTYNEVIIAGLLELKQIQHYLKDKTFFVPSEVGLPDLQESVFTIDDHIWHEIDSIRPTTEKPTTSVHADVLRTQFKKAHQNGWNEYAVFERKGLI